MSRCHEKVLRGLHLSQCKRTAFDEDGFCHQHHPATKQKRYEQKLKADESKRSSHPANRLYDVARDYRELKAAVRQLLNDLPDRRDWLDPQLEFELRERSK